MKKKMSLFTKIYISVVAFFLVLLIAAGTVLWFFLDTFEITRPNYTAQKIFTDCFKSGNIGQLVKEYSPEQLKFEDEQSLNREFKEQYDLSKLNYFSFESGQNGEEVYVVSYDGAKLADFTLAPNEHKGFGMRDYALVGAKLYLTQSEAVSVLVRKGCTLKLNGITVDSSYIAEPDIKDASYDHMPTGIEGILYDKYTVSEFLFEPEITVADADGVEQAAELNKTVGCYEVPKTYSTELQQNYSQYVISAITEYAKYLSNVSDFTHIEPYLDPESALYKNVKNVSVTWLWKHKSYKISDEKAYDFYSYGDGVFSCRAYLKDTLISYSNKEHVEFVDVTVYLRKVNGDYLIYDMVNN